MLQCITRIRPKCLNRQFGQTQLVVILLSFLNNWNEKKVTYIDFSLIDIQYCGHYILWKCMDHSRVPITVFLTIKDLGVTQEWSVHFDKIRSALNHTANIKEYTIRTHDYLSQRSHLYTSKTKFNSHTQLK